MKLARELLLLAFAKEVDVGNDGTFGTPILALIAHACQKPAIADADLDLATDLSGHSDGGVGIVRAIGEPLNIDRDLRSGASYFEHHADGKRGVFAGSGRIRLFGRFRGRFGL